LFYLEHSIQDASLTRAGDRRTVSKRMLYVELDPDGNTHSLHYAPYLDYRPLTNSEPSVDAILSRPECEVNKNGTESVCDCPGCARHLTEVRSATI
jgi:hypothetical protein